VQRVLEFLGVDAGLTLSLEITHPNKVVVHRRLQALAMQPPNRIENLYPSVTPPRFHGRLAAFISKKSVIYKARPSLDSRVRQKLQQELSDDILRLGKLLDRDLSHWLSSVESESP
jgi:hypothetical protein